MKTFKEFMKESYLGAGGSGEIDSSRFRTSDEVKIEQPKSTTAKVASTNQKLWKDRRRASGPTGLDDKSKKDSIAGPDNATNFKATH